MQSTSHILMIRPVNFSFNAETAVNNAFQKAGDSTKAQEKARQEFDQFVQKLELQGIDLTVVDDSPEPYTPDSIFPNNWVSFHSGGEVILYPMFAANRRAERKPEVLSAIFKKFRHSTIIDLTASENENQFLEGTGSMVLDRDHKIAYACLSPRTHNSLIEEFAKKMSYETICFHSLDQRGQEIYHTNVMMCIADRYAVICLDSIKNPVEREWVVNKLIETDKTIIEISMEQMNSFAGNMLQVLNQNGKPILVMSSQAYESLSPEQVSTLEFFNPILHADLRTIETNGGGSARCMMAEIFLPPVGS